MQVPLQKTAIGIDFGSLKSVIAAINKEGCITLLHNEASQIETPNMLIYNPYKERIIGQQAKDQEARYFQNTIKYLNRLLQLSDNQDFYKYNKWSKLETQENAQKQLSIQVSSGNQTYQLTPIQLIASMLTKLKQQIISEGYNSKNIIISVPSFFSEYQKQLIRNAARIAQLDISDAVEENILISLDYGFYKRNDYQNDESENVLFLDFGHSKLSTFVTQFSQNGLEILFEDDHNYLGVKNIDDLLLNYYQEKLLKEKNITLSPKQQYRLENLLKQQRIILSANTQSSFSLENILMDEDLTFEINRSILQQIIQPLESELEMQLDQILEQLHQQQIRIDRIELIGGGSRIPLFYELISSKFNISPSKTLHATECIAKGAAIMSALKLKKLPYYIEKINKKQNIQGIEDIAYSEQQLDYYRQIEKAMINYDTIVIESQEKKNELESYIYSSKQQINEKFKNILDQSVIDEFEQKLNYYENWIYEEGKYAQKSELESILKQLQSINKVLANSYISIQEEEELKNNNMKMELEKSRSVQEREEVEKQRQKQIKLLKKQKEEEEASQAKLAAEREKQNALNQKKKQQHKKALHKKELSIFEQSIKEVQELGKICNFYENQLKDLLRNKIKQSEKSKNLIQELKNQIQKLRNFISTVQEYLQTQPVQSEIQQFPKNLKTKNELFCQQSEQLLEQIKESLNTDILKKKSKSIKKRSDDYDDFFGNNNVFHPNLFQFF